MLRALIHQIWLPEGEDPDWPIRVTSGPPPAGYRAVERYAVVPSPDRARFLIPLNNRAVAAGSLSHYNGLRSTGVRRPRAALALGYRTGAATALLRHRLVVSAREDLPPEKLGDHLLSAHLREALQVPQLALGVGVRAPDPNQKPTLQLFDLTGRPVGYAKIGWSPATREMTVREAAALETVGAQAELPVRVPAVLHHGSWRDYQITVVAPLPPTIKRHRDAATAPPSPFTGAPGTLGDSGFWQALRTEVDRLRTDPAEPRAGELLPKVFDDLTREHGATRLDLGRWHGDWVPWNLGWYGDELHVWDWEHSAPSAPIGFDLLHWRFQVTLVLNGRPLAEAVHAVRTAAQAELTGIPAEQRPLIAKLYLIEMFTRTYRLNRMGGGWNPAIYPEMLKILESL